MVQTILTNPENYKGIKIELSPTDLVNAIDQGVRNALSAFGHSSQAKTENEDFIDRKELMEMAGIKSHVTLWRYEKEGYLTPYKFGNRIRYKRKEAIAAFEQLNRNEQL